MLIELSPYDVEFHLAGVLGEIVGRWHETWHILRYSDHMPALMLVCHGTLDIDWLYRLCRLMFEAHVPRGYLVTLEIAPPDVVHAAHSIGIILLDAVVIELLLSQILEALWTPLP